MNMQEETADRWDREQMADIRQLALKLALKAGVGTPIAQPGQRRSPGPYGFSPLAQHAYSARRARERYFEKDLFGEPAWDMLLDLFLQMNDGRKVSITSACIAAAVPPTTALRWVSLLAKRGLIVRTDDPADARRAFVELTKPTFLKFNDYFEAVGNGLA